MTVWLWTNHLILDNWLCDLGQGTLLYFVTYGLWQGTWYFFCDLRSWTRHLKFFEIWLLWVRPWKRHLTLNWWLCGLGKGTWFMLAECATLDKALYTDVGIRKPWTRHSTVIWWLWTRNWIFIWWVFDLGQDIWFVFCEYVTLDKTHGSCLVSEQPWTRQMIRDACPLSRLDHSNIMSGGVKFL